MRPPHGPAAVAPIERTNGEFRRLEICQTCGSGPAPEEVLTETVIESALSSLDAPEASLDAPESYPDDVMICRRCDTRMGFYDDDESAEGVGTIQEEYAYIDDDGNGVIIEEIVEDEEIQKEVPWDNVPVKGCLESLESFEMVVMKRMEEEEEVLEGSNAPMALEAPEDSKLQSSEDQDLEGSRQTTLEGFKAQIAPVQTPPLSRIAPEASILTTDLEYSEQKDREDPEGSKLRSLEDQALEGPKAQPASNEAPKTVLDAREASIWTRRTHPHGSPLFYEPTPKLPVPSGIPKILTPEDYVQEQVDARRESYITPLEDLYAQYNHQPILQNGIIRVIHTPPPPRRVSFAADLRRTSSCGTLDTAKEETGRPFWYIDDESETQSTVGGSTVVEVEEKSSGGGGCLPAFLRCLVCQCFSFGEQGELAEANDTVEEVKPTSASGRGRLARRMTIEEEHAGDYFNCESSEHGAAAAPSPPPPSLAEEPKPEQQKQPPKVEASPPRKFLITPPPSLPSTPPSSSPPSLASPSSALSKPQIKAVNLLAPSVFAAETKSQSSSSFRELFSLAAPVSEGPWDSDDNDEDDEDFVHHHHHSSRHSIMSDDSFQKELDAAGYDKNFEKHPKMVEIGNPRGLGSIQHNFDYSGSLEGLELYGLEDGMDCPEYGTEETNSPSDMPETVGPKFQVPIGPSLLDPRVLASHET
ncbi:hypothetical protein L5515_000133 [Caenorhabditis briggsae]|uniref:Uncharacterized protein n=1 Tax=Caenorhabditis briggsae TaxID=6238 RepID=A0AAE9J1U4_CAEBR|nr:hypothetical protein L5515_000133 [Caenorhabditis briggsae]